MTYIMLVYNLLKKIFNSVKPEFTHNVQDFVLKHKHHGGQFYYVMYSANCGKSWKHVYKYSPPLFNHNGECLFEYYPSIIKYVFDSSRTSFSDVRKLFPSYQSILDYEHEQRTFYNLACIEHKKMQENYVNKITNNLK